MILGRSCGLPQISQSAPKADSAALVMSGDWPESNEDPYNLHPTMVLMIKLLYQQKCSLIGDCDVQPYHASNWSVTIGPTLFTPGTAYMVRRFFFFFNFWGNLPFRPLRIVPHTSFLNVTSHNHIFPRGSIFKPIHLRDALKNTLVAVALSRTPKCC